MPTNQITNQPTVSDGPDLEDLMRQMSQFVNERQVGKVLLMDFSQYSMLRTQMPTIQPLATEYGEDFRIRYSHSLNFGIPIVQTPSMHFHVGDEIKTLGNKESQKPAQYGSAMGFWATLLVVTAMFVFMTILTRI